MYNQLRSIYQERLLNPQKPNLNKTNRDFNISGPAELNPYLSDNIFDYPFLINLYSITGLPRSPPSLPTPILTNFNLYTLPEASFTT